MSRVCQVSGKGPLTGNNRSHSLRATRRVYNPNLQTYRLTDEQGRVYKVKMTARAHRSLLKDQVK